MGRHPFAQDEKLLHSQGFADLGAGLAANDDRLDPRQIAFQVLRKLPKEQFAYDCPQDRIAEEFQALIGSQAVLRPRGMRQRSLEQMLVVKRIADSLFTAP